MTTDIKDVTREVTMSTNRQIGFASEFARRVGARPGTKLLQTLVRLPGGTFAVLVMRRPKSYTTLLVDALAPSGKGGTAFLRKLRDEWGEEAATAKKKCALPRSRLPSATCDGSLSIRPSGSRQRTPPIRVSRARGGFSTRSSEV